MTPRLRMLAGPNGSGKPTLAQQLADDYAGADAESNYKKRETDTEFSPQKPRTCSL